MPLEAIQLENAPVPFKTCPKCDAPFEPFLRGMVGRSPRTLFSWPPFKLRKHCALICSGCKEIVGHEAPESCYGPPFGLPLRGIDIYFILQILALWIAVAVALNGCASSVKSVSLPVLPPPIDIGTLVPAPEPFAVPAHVARYPDTRVSRAQCPGLPAGILVSPAAYAEQIHVGLDRNRLRAETRALEQLRTSERQAATELAETCRARAGELAGEVEAARRWMSLRGAVLFVAGALVGGFTVYVSRAAAGLK